MWTVLIQLRTRISCTYLITYDWVLVWVSCQWAQNIQINLWPLIRSLLDSRINKRRPIFVSFCVANYSLQHFDVSRKWLWIIISTFLHVRLFVVLCKKTYRDIFALLTKNLFKVIRLLDVCQWYCIIKLSMLLPLMIICKKGSWTGLTYTNFSQILFIAINSDKVPR